MPRKRPPDDPAERLAAYLFTNGLGKRGERLVITDADRRDLGGWSRTAVVEAIRQFFPPEKGPKP